ncbi:hypothetical protein SS1G_09448 [Sclerotinia sclerotiorum 1980 UF-70]|uniref:Rhodopsin domain-containing protein n=1 Tax=Sclerotinia sclerotiorum (strain ATCC 18683 / 1980 / Ss-1) TaxID=665079 RepID=A7EVT9_SCLS1|nr:hypothetical protein SS1G_09448 [Sclerotinia sclerotiorum 1980 UF-70]EDN93581.1 hypothetical protein SS1G_09448 [Sclerotinia sclerotiorum 1980 UF-70]
MSYDIDVPSTLVLGGLRVRIEYTAVLHIYKIMTPTSTLSPATDATYHGTRLVIFTAIWIPVLVICVALRYFARWMIRGPWGIDDILVFTSLFLQLGQAGISIASVKNAGVGYHVSYLESTDPALVQTWGKYLVAIATVYFGGVNIPKLAILALYKRLFPTKGILLVIHILMAALIALTISTIITNLAACRPFSANWDSTIKATCINKEAFFIWGSIPNIITDIIILILPMRVVWNLHANRRMKIGLTITFAVGSFGLITSIIRFTTFFRNNSFIDGTWSAVDLIIWTQVEAGVYLISCCLPTWRPILERIGQKNFLRKLISRVTATVAKPPTNVTSEGSSNIQLQSNLSKRGKGFHRLESGGGDNSAQNILVTKDVTVVEGKPGLDDLDGYREASRKENFDWGDPERHV